MRYSKNSALYMKKQKILFLSGIFIAVFSFGLFLHVFPAHAMSMGDPTPTVDTQNMNPLMRIIESDNPMYTPVEVILDVICVILMLIASFIIIKSIREYGKSTVGIALLYLFNAVFVLGAIKVIFILDDDSIASYANVKDVTEMFIWHTLFYYSLFLFYLAGKTLTGLVSTERKRSSYPNAKYLFIFSVVFSLILIISMPIPAVQDFLVKNLQNTWFETFGWFHIIALLLAGGIAIFLYQVKNKFKGYTGVIGNLYIALMLMAAIHAWELLNESWHWIIVSDDFGEFIERCIWIPVFLFILYSFAKLRSLTSASQASLSQPQNNPQLPPSPSLPTATPSTHSVSAAQDMPSSSVANSQSSNA